MPTKIPTTREMAATMYADVEPCEMCCFKDKLTQEHAPRATHIALVALSETISYPWTVCDDCLIHRVMLGGYGRNHDRVVLVKQPESLAALHDALGTTHAD